MQVGEGMLSTVIKIKRAECCLAMRPGRDYCPAQNNIIRVRRLKECPLFRQYFVLTKVLSSCTFTMALATCRKMTADRSLDPAIVTTLSRQCEFVQLVCVTMRNKSHVLVTLLSRECLYSGNWRSILSVRYYVLLCSCMHNYIKQKISKEKYILLLIL